MPKFSIISKNRLKTCHPDLQRLFNEVIRHENFAVICGRRGMVAQNAAFLERRSQFEFPGSKHNAIPSLATDVAPWPINWKNEERFIYFAGIVKGIAIRMGIKIIWGGDWDQDSNPKNEKFRDLGHFELA